MIDRRKQILIAIIIIMMIMVLVLVFIITRVLVLYGISRKTNQALANTVIQTPLPIDTATPEQESDTLGSDSVGGDEAEIEQIPILIDWNNLELINPDVRAWLFCNDTNISYPVVQGKDNTYYLTHNSQRKKDQAGALFFDYRNILFSEYENLVIYGHRMKDGSMFGNLARFSDEEYFKNHSTFYLLTEDQNYRIIFFACRTVSSKAKYFPTSFASKVGITEFYEKAIEQSYWDNQKTSIPDHSIMITLSTCSKYDFTFDARLVLNGFAIPLGS